MAPGVQIFTSFSTGKETTAGTAVATTREWYPDGTGGFDEDTMLALHRGNRGTRTQLAHATSQGVVVDIPYSSDADIGAAYDELHIVYGQLDGGNTGVGAGADKTWTIAPSQTGANAQESYTIEVGDDNQFWEFEYCQARAFTLSAAIDNMTQLSVDWFGRQATKTTATAVAANTAVRIPGYLWKPRFATAQSGLAGASDVANFMVDWSATYQTGLIPRFYQDGLAYFGQTVEAQEMKADLTLHVESTALAVTEFYDKWKARTVDFIQLKATDPTVLGGSFYSVQLQFAVLYTKVQPIASESDGVNIYEVTAETVLDPTWGTSLAAVIVNSLATIT